MRRFRQQMPREEAIEILRSSTGGVLCLTDSTGQPYGVPMSFVYCNDNTIYFHCALQGRKIDCIKHNRKACFTIIDRDEVHPAEFTTYFRSVIVEGVITVIDNPCEMIDALRLLSSKYSPGLDCEPEIEKGINRVLILRFDINTITGKEAIEITASRKSD